MEIKKIVYSIKKIIGMPYIELYFIFTTIRSRIEIKDSYETVNYILKHHCSISRYGDGEFNMILQYVSNGEYKIGNGFQRYNKNLAKRLYEILKEEAYPSNHIVCIPYWFKRKGLIIYKRDVKYFCLKYFYKHYKDIISCINKHRIYYNANISRFYMSYKDKSGCRDYVHLLQKIWNKRDVYFVEGEYSRLGVGNDLFANALSIRRILCPSIDAFDFYDTIVMKIKELVPIDGLVILALGHTATVMAYDLSKLGYQALDLGHIDVEYEWMIHNAKNKIKLKNKYVNEAGGIESDPNFHDVKYKSQIIAQIPENKC